MRRHERVVLLSWPRTGSSSLWRLLGAHPELSLMEDEPFNENFAGWSPANSDYLSRIAPGVDPFLRVLDELLDTYDGIKVLDYQLDEGQLAALVTRPALSMIYLRRRNLLQTAVSDRIAKQVRIWNRWDVGSDEELGDRYRSLHPLDIDDLRAYMKDLRAHLAWIDTILDRRTDPPVHQVCYEDLFLSSPVRQRVVLNALWAFLSLTPATDPLLDRFLDHRNARLGASDTYGRLPNADQVNDLLGSEEAGFLPPFML